MPACLRRTSHRPERPGLHFAMPEGRIVALAMRHELGTQRCGALPVCRFGRRCTDLAAVQDIAVQPGWRVRLHEVGAAVRPGAGCPAPPRCPQPPGCARHRRTGPAGTRAVHQDGFEAALEQTADQAMAPVEELAIDPVDVAHQAREIGLPRVRHQMEVVAHQAGARHLCVEAVPPWAMIARSLPGSRSCERPPRSGRRPQ